MSRKSRHIKKLASVIVLLLIVISSKLYLGDNLDRTNNPSPQTKKIVLQPPAKNIKPQVFTLPAPKKSEEANNTLTSTKMLGGFQLKEFFQCDMSIDENLVEQVRQTLASYSYEIPLTIKKHQINDLLAINVISSDLPIKFSSTINDKIKLILLLYKKWFGLTLKEPMTMNLVLLPSLESYSDILSTLSIDSTNSQGLFWANSNFAFVAYRTEQQLEQTIIHELVHALNFYLVGYSARWLTEGLADYFKKIEFHIEGNQYIYSFNHVSTPHSPPPLIIDDLIYLENEWDSNQRSHLYASAFQLVAFLIKHKEEKNILRRLLNKEAMHPCNALNSSTYLNLINENLLDLSEDF